MSNRSSQIVGILQTMADDFAVPLSCLCKFVGFPVEHGFHGKAHFFARQEDLQKEVDQEKGNKKAYEASGSTSAICWWSVDVVREKAGLKSHWSDMADIGAFRLRNLPVQSQPRSKHWKIRLWPRHRTAMDG